MNRTLTLFACLIFAFVGRNVLAEGRLHDFHVLGIGLSDYRKNPGDHLRTAASDVQSLAKFFVEQDHPGAKETLRRTRSLYNASATKKGIEQQLADLPNWVAEGSTLAIIYAGHGERFGGHWLLLPYDIDADHFEESCVSGETLMNAVDAVIAKKHCRVIVILNSCHSGEVLAAAEPLMAKYRDPAQGGLILMAACNPGETSIFSRFGGIFTSAILTGLKGDAHVEATDSVSLREIGRYLRSNVPQRLHSEAWKAPGFDWLEQNIMIEHSQSISEDIGIVAAKANHANVSPAAETSKNGPPSNCTVIKTKNSPVGMWICTRPLVIEPSPFSSVQPTTWMRIAHPEMVEAAQPIVVMNEKQQPLVDVLALQLFEDGHYEVAYLVAPATKPQIAVGRYRFQPGVEFSLSYSNGTDYFSLQKLDSKEMVLRVGSSLGCSPVRSNPEFRFKRMEPTAK